MDRLRVIHIISSLQVGGMEQFALRLAARQRSRGLDASLLALNGGPLLDVARIQEVPVRVLGGRHKLPRVGWGILHFASRRPQIVHAHNPTSLHYAALGRKVTRARVVMTYHGVGAAHPREPSATEWRGTDAVVSVSAGAVAQLQRPELGDRLRVILNGVDLPQAGRPRAELRRELALGDRLTGIMVARMDGLKGHAPLLQALTSDSLRSLPLTILLAGDGAIRGELEREAARLGLADDRVRFLGFRSDVADLLAAADFFLLPSRTEGLPLSLLEAMSHGLPVVATPVGGIPEVVTPDAEGLFVAVDNPAELGSAIYRLATDEALRKRLGLAARERVSRELSFDVMAARYEELYQSLLT